MRTLTSIFSCFVLVFCASSVQAQPTPLKLENLISVAYLREKLGNDSPRLVLNRKIEDNLKKKLKTDPIVQNTYKAIKRNAEGVFKRSIINLDIPLEERS